MRSRIAFCVILAALSWPPTMAQAAGIGFVPSSGVWFSNDPVFSNIATKIFTVVVNNQYQKLNAVIAFFDNDTEFSRTNINIGMEEAHQIAGIWNPGYGQHTLVARFISATGTDSTGNSKQLSTAELNSLAAPISRTLEIDNDSDQDGLGDHEEISTYHTAPLIADTDGDGLKDGEEIKKYHTDPNKADTDGDGMNDGDEIKNGRNPLLPDAPPPLPPPTPASISSTQNSAPTQKTETQKNTTIKSTEVAPTTNKSNTNNSTGQTNVNTAPTNNKSQTDSQKSTTTNKEQSQNKPPDSPGSNGAATTSTSPDTYPTVISSNGSTNFSNNSNNINWIKVLGVVAGLLVVAAAVSGGLALRERNRY